MIHQANREFVAKKLYRLRVDVTDERYRKLWVDYHDLVLSMPDDFFAVRPYINDDGHMSWAGLGKMGFVKRPSITYRIHHPFGAGHDTPELEVLLELETEFGGTAQFAMWTNRMKNGKYQDVILLEHLKDKFNQWLFDQL